ncbi:hypothetical protein BDV93DRAFT_506190 [Ceratobasidium sp. AG-I]|nr:hypothetical protein BDV93DRAFT_506190 [Ceratobasidium sp. AG-I]
MPPHLSAKLLEPASPLIASDQSDDDEIVYLPYYRPSHSHTQRKPHCRSHQLTSEARAEIVTRVLNPAYSGRHDQSLKVFVDHHGNAHNPNGFFRCMPRKDELAREDNAELEVKWARTCEIVVPVVQPKCRKNSKAGSTPKVPCTVYVPMQPMIVEPVAAIEEDNHDLPAVAYLRHSAVELVHENTMDTTKNIPSCGYVLHHQWATFALHTRLGAHCIARRARCAVSVGT